MLRTLKNLFKQDREKKLNESREKLRFTDLNLKILTKKAKAEH